MKTVFVPPPLSLATILSTPNVYFFLYIAAELASAAEDKASFQRLQPEHCLPGGCAGLLVPLLPEA